MHRVALIDKTNLALCMNMMLKPDVSSVYVTN